MKGYFIFDARSRGLISIIQIAVSLMASCLTSFADFAEHEDAKSPQEACKILLQKLADLKINGTVISLTEKDADSNLSAGKTERGILVSLNVSHFRMEGHGDTANDHEYLTEFPVQPPKDSRPVKRHSLPLKKIVPLMNKEFIPLKMVSHGMRRMDSKQLSWASSRLLIEFKDFETAEKLLPALVEIIFQEQKGKDLIVIPKRREDEP